MEEKLLLLGDQAVALGAIHAGITGVYAYPGTPSTEITEYIQTSELATLRGVHSRWCTNEKTAMEAALGVSYVGKRALVCMKHVGLNVAADAFVNSAVTGTNGGLVVLVADDPSMHSSQNEQDSRFYGKFAFTPMLEPSSQQEAYDMMSYAFDLSEQHKLPVLMRITTRMAHSRAVISPGRIREQNELGFPDDAAHWVLLPVNARRCYGELLGQQPALEALAAESSYNSYTDGPNRKTGVIACGIGYNYLMENFPAGCDFPVLKLSQYPLPKTLVRRMAETCDEILVLEDGQPFVEEQLRGVLPTAVRIRGRLSNDVPRTGELTPDNVKQALGLESAPGFAPSEHVTPRPPALCSGCGHLPVFSVSGSGIGSGAIGGYIPKYENGASEIAGQIADFYKKKPRVVHFDPTENEYRFDLQKLKEFGIAEYKLPSGSIVVDTVEARLQKYESYILILIIIFIVLSLFIAFLYYLYYRNKKLKISLENRGRELIAAKEKAEESDMLKSAFLANMSHEIRTPLNAIVGFSALLGDESISEEDRNVYMGIVNQNSDLLLTLIGDILDISRLETGKISFTLHPENIVAICQQVISTTAHGRKKGVECVFNPPVESFILKTDSQRLSQVLINLLTNASKFTEKGTIALAFEIQKEQRRILFSVSDTGCGIPRERQERVFNRFEKLNEFKQGTGLGLAICKQIVLRFGGNIWIDPEYTKGARFVFSHPIVP